MTFRTKDEFIREKARMGAAKGASTRANNALRRLCSELGVLIERRENDSSDWSETTAKKTAEAIQRSRGISEAALETLDSNE